MKSHLPRGPLCTAWLIAATASALSDQDKEVQKREVFQDKYNIFIRKRHAHACMMSIVFIVLFPLAAISLHLPLKGVRVISFIHAPIQIIGGAMMIGAMGLGIDIAKNDLNYFGNGPVKAHIMIGLLVTSSIILFQPALGLLQHRHFRRTGQKSFYAYIHRCVGRVMICLGWINSGLGFQLMPIQLVPKQSLVRNFVLMGVLGGIWFLLMGIDGIRGYWYKKDRLSSFSIGWDKGFRIRGSRDEKDATEDSTGGTGVGVPLAD